MNLLKEVQDLYQENYKTMPQKKWQIVEICHICNGKFAKMAITSNWSIDFTQLLLKSKEVFFF